MEWKYNHTLPSFLYIDSNSSWLLNATSEGNFCKESSTLNGKTCKCMRPTARLYISRSVSVDHTIKLYQNWQSTPEGLGFWDSCRCRTISHWIRLPGHCYLYSGNTEEHPVCTAQKSKHSGIFGTIYDCSLSQTAPNTDTKVLKFLPNLDAGTAQFSYPTLSGCKGIEIKNLLT